MRQVRFGGVRRVIDLVDSDEYNIYEDEGRQKHGGQRRTVERLLECAIRAALHA